MSIASQKNADHGSQSQPDSERDAERAHRIPFDPMFGVVNQIFRCAAATEHLARGEHGVLVGLVRGEVSATPLDEVVANTKPLDLRLLELAGVLAK